MRASAAIMLRPRAGQRQRPASAAVPLNGKDAALPGRRGAQLGDERQDRAVGDGDDLAVEDEGDL